MHKMLFVVPMMLTACAAEGRQRVPIDSVYPGSKCTPSGALDTFKGETASTELAARIMMASRARTLRWVPFGAMVTMEYNENRVTVRLDQQNRVISATCG
ncbi:MAG TPA: I78 family peptidase inhibitor [Sphingomicrobium sp.]|nr:I78 family peptidase inhibitor [Sphingomicrobium sp.]